MSSSFLIFNATKSLPPRNNLPPWAVGTNPWPQVLLLVMASVSLLTCLVVFYGYWKGGHRRAEKVAVYYTVFSVCFFALNTVMWVIGAAVFQNSKATGNGEDLWGWSCKDNVRRQLFSQEVKYSLICRMQVGLSPTLLSSCCQIFNFINPRTGAWSAPSSRLSLN